MRCHKYVICAECNAKINEYEVYEHCLWSLRCSVYGCLAFQLVRTGTVDLVGSINFKSVCGELSMNCTEVGLANTVLH